jgi:hypothetical protein
MISSYRSRSSRSSSSAGGPIIATFPLLVTAPGFGWINAYTVASEIGDIERFASPAKLCGYTGLCPRVYQSGSTDRRGPISKHGPHYLRWGLFEAAMNACKHPLSAERYQRTKHRLGRQRGPQGRPDRTVAQGDRGDLAHAHRQPTVRSGGAPVSSSRLTALSLEMRHRSMPPITPNPHTQGAIET